MIEEEPINKAQKSINFEIPKAFGAFLISLKRLGYLKE
jgi:hypothetical protein